MDWGMAFSVGLAIVIISEITILGAVAMPKIPLEPGKTWRGTISAVSGISLIIGGVGGYVAGQFGGRGGGGETVPGQAAISTQTAPQMPVSSQPVKPDTTRQEQPESYLYYSIDMYFVRGKDGIPNFTCELMGYRRKGTAWEHVPKPVRAKDLAEFLKVAGNELDNYQKEIPPPDLPNKVLRIFMDPDPGYGTYQQLKQQAEKQGWKVERKGVAWQPENPS